MIYNTVLCTSNAKTATDEPRATPLVMIVNTKQPTQQGTGRLACRQRSSSGLHIVYMSRDYTNRRHLHTLKASGGCDKLVSLPIVHRIVD